MAYADEHPGYRIGSEDEARNCILDLVKDVEAARGACNINIPDNYAAQAQLQMKAYRVFMIKHGSALGYLMAFHRVGKLSDIAYNELRQRVLDTLAPTLVGVVHHNI